MAMSASAPATSKFQTGAWTKLERVQFEQGVIAHGWGNWSSMVGTIIPTRNRNQLKSHAQKFRRVHPEMVEVLMREHEIAHRKRAALGAKNAPRIGGGAATVAAEARAKKGKKSSSPPRRRASMIKAKTPASARKSPRQPRRFSAPGSIEFMDSSRSNFSTPAKRTSFTNTSARKKHVKIQSSPPQPAAPAPPPPSTPDSILSRVISDMCRTTLGSDEPSTSVLFSELLSPPPHHLPHSSLLNTSPSAYQNSQDDDELATLAAKVTFSSDPSSTYDKFIRDVLETYTSSHSETSIDYVLDTNQNEGSTFDGFDEATMDPLLNLKVEGRDLDLIFEVGKSEKQDCEMKHNINLARPNPQIREHIRSILVSPTDYNSPAEYILAADGVSRTGLHRGAVCRARIKKLLGDHFDLACCNDEEFVNHSLTFDTRAGLIQSALDACYTLGPPGSFGEVVGGGEEGTLKTFVFESFVALAAAMLDVNDWHTPGIGDPIIFVRDVEDTRDVGSHLHDLWECLKHHHRFDCELYDADNITTATERNAAISSIVEQLKLICHVEHSSI